MSSTVVVSTNPLLGLTASATSTTASANPLKTDPELKRHISELPQVTTRKAFDRWRQSFLARYEVFLGQTGGTGEAAPAAYQAFCDKLTNFSHLILHVLPDDWQHGRLTVKACSVSGRKHLAECQKGAVQVTRELSALTPATLELEQTYGYTKFQLGALLVRHGFAEYHVLAECDEAIQGYLQQAKTSATVKSSSTTDMDLTEIADRQWLESMQEYQTKLEIFCDIMADLGLYAAMLKCHEINQLPPEPESEPEPEEESESESESESSMEEPPPKKKEKPPQKKSESDFDPYTIRLSFPSLRPPSGPFIKFVDTGAKSADECVKGVVPRGQLSSGEFQYNHDKDGENNNNSNSHNSFNNSGGKMEFKMNTPDETLTMTSTNESIGRSPRHVKNTVAASSRPTVVLDDENDNDSDNDSEKSERKTKSKSKSKKKPSRSTSSSSSKKDGKKKSGRSKSSASVSSSKDGSTSTSTSSKSKSKSKSKVKQ